MKEKGISIIAIVLSIASIFLVFYTKNVEDSVYVDMGRIYGEFTLTTQLESEYEVVFKARKRIIDSLIEDLKMKAEQVQSQKEKNVEQLTLYARQEQAAMFKKQEFEKDNDLLKAQMTDKIWKRLNQYISDYGDKNKYTFIFGANGQGNIMYANKMRNITDDVIKYVNARYLDK